MRCCCIGGLDAVRWNGEEVRLGSSLWANDGKSERVVGDAHHKAINGRCSGPNILGTQGKPFGVGGDETISRQMTCPNADAAADGGAWTAMRGARHCHGTQREARREMRKTGEWLHLVLRRDGSGQHAILHALQTR